MSIYAHILKQASCIEHAHSVMKRRLLELVRIYILSHSLQSCDPRRV